MARKTGSEVRALMDKEYADRKKEYGGYEKYEVEDWVRTLQSASEILSDASKMKAVVKCMDKKEASVATLKQLVNGTGKSKQQGRDD